MGALLSVIVAIMWTGTALFADVASRSIGASVFNVWRMLLSVPLLLLTVWAMTGSAIVPGATTEVWLWLLASGFVGYVFGDYCLFHSYEAIGSRFGQLFMTLASPFAAIAAYLIMDEGLTLRSLTGMVITLTGIGMNVLGKSHKKHSKTPLTFNLPLRGILLAIGAALGQGVGLVLSKQGMLAWNADTNMQLAFSATMIRGLMGLAGFSLTLIIRHETNKLLLPLRSWKAAISTTGAVLFGPYFGVSLSLLAVSMTNAGVAQTLMSLTPVFIIWPSHLLFGSKVRTIEIIGAIIAVCGAAMLF